MISLNRISKKLLLLQRNELLSKNQYWLRKRFGRLIFTNFFVNYFQVEDIEKRTEELFQKEVELIKNHLPKKVENIMDIGCGLGIINIFLNKIYNNQPNFFLLDKNKIDKVVLKTRTEFVLKPKFDEANTLGIIKKIINGFFIPPVRYINPLN